MQGLTLVTDFFFLFMKTQWKTKRQKSIWEAAAVKRSAYVQEARGVRDRLSLLPVGSHLSTSLLVSPLTLIFFPPFISDTFPALHFLSPHLDNFPLCFLFSPAFVKKSLWWNAWSLPDNCLSSSHWNITPVFSPVLFVCVCDGVWLWSYMRQTIMAVNLMCSKTPFSRIKSHHRDSVSP